MVTCVACGVNSGCSAKGLNLQSGVIGKTVITVMLLDVTGFLQGVVLEGIAGFGDILSAANLPVSGISSVQPISFREWTVKRSPSIWRTSSSLWALFVANTSSILLEYDVHDLARNYNHLADGLTVDVALSLLVGQNGILNLLLGGIGREVHCKAGLSVE